jgi:hypothetical protein
MLLAWRPGETLTAHARHPADRTDRARREVYLEKASGVTLWDANTLDRWAASYTGSHGELITARFLLAVWDPEHTWSCGRFELMEALRVWNDRHRAAFLKWASDPWWP